MKHTPADLKEILTTGEDKVAKIREIKKTINAMPQLKCKVVRRKMASGRKAYFTIEHSGGLDTARGYRLITEEIIKKHFPEVSLTSGGSISWTFSEYT